MGVLLFELSLTFYFAAAIVSIVELFRGTKATSYFILIFAVAGFILHTATIIVRYTVSGHVPITSLHEASSFFAWCIVLIFFFLEYRYRVDLLGPFTMPIVFILMLSSSI